MMATSRGLMKVSNTHSDDHKKDTYSLNLPPSLCQEQIVQQRKLSYFKKKTRHRNVKYNKYTLFLEKKMRINFKINSDVAEKYRFNILLTYISYYSIIKLYSRFNKYILMLP